MLEDPACSPAVLYANSHSRRGQEWYQQAVETLKKEGMELRDSRLIDEPKELDRQVAAAVKAKTPLVIVGGGDGTLSLVARHFVGSDSTLGVLPLGTGNAFARDLSIVASVQDACQTILSGQTRGIDLGQVGDDYFINVMTAGLTARIVTELTDENKKRFGRAAYLFAMTRALAKVQAFHAVLSCPERRLEFETLQVVIGNGRYHAGPFPLAEDASITEGRLSVYALATTNRAAFLKLAWALRSGRQAELPEVYSVATVGGKLETTPIRKVVVDGEISRTTPIEFRVVPEAIRVRVPATFEG